MSRLHFRLSTLLFATTFLAVSVGLSYRVHLLQQRVSQLQSELNAVKQTRVQAAFHWPIAPVMESDGVELGMKASEFEHRGRMWRHFGGQESLLLPMNRSL